VCGGSRFCGIELLKMRQYCQNVKRKLLHSVNFFDNLLTTP